ncbi:MAG: hypothetical protein ACJ8C4_01060 [Gemmataceae bacterium]
MRKSLLIGFGLVVATAVLAEEPAKKEESKGKVAPLIKLIFSSKAEAPADKPKTPPLPTGTHETTKTTSVKGETKGLKLQTLCSGSDGMVYALLGSDRYGDKVSSGEVQVFDTAGEKIRGWKLNFQGQAINCAPNGTVYVAGDGKIAAFDAEGHIKSESDLPFVKTLLGDVDKIKKKAEEQRQSEIQSAEEQVKEFKKEADEIRKKDEDKRTDTEKSQLKRNESMAKVYEQMLERAKKKSVDDMVGQTTSRLKAVNAVAATDKDLFVVSGEMKGYGYAVWRMDPSFDNAKQVMSGLRGCCGQMDIQCCDDCLVVAQNCDHNVGKYDREGKKISTFGKRAGRDDTDGFGSCCNPMNVRAGAEGRVYTAESEGIVRVFDKDGKQEGVIGTVKVSGGCKNVAIAVSADGNTVWFCDQPNSKIHVMTRKVESAKAVN